MEPTEGHCTASSQVLFPSMEERSSGIGRPVISVMCCSCRNLEQCESVRQSCRSRFLQKQDCVDGTPVFCVHKAACMWDLSISITVGRALTTKSFPTFCNMWAMSILKQRSFCILIFCTPRFLRKSTFVRYIRGANCSQCIHLQVPSTTITSIS